MCDKPPNPQSIYCSSDCIVKHATKAKEAFLKEKTVRGKKVCTLWPKKCKSVRTLNDFHLSIKASSSSALPPSVMVMDPKSNTTLIGPSAPSGKNLEAWLLRHPTYHVVMPTSLPSSRFYG